MPVKLEGDSPSKVCPKCEPHLAPMAGSSSAEQGIPREPQFSRRKKLPGHEKQVTFTTDYVERGSSTAEDNMALKFKAGYRRVNDSGHPSTYQMNYRWKERDPSTDAPLIEAASEGGQQQKPSKVVVTSEHACHPPKTRTVHERDEMVLASGERSHAHATMTGAKVHGRPGTKVAKRRRTPVEPLVLPDSDSKDEGDGESRRRTEPLRTRDTAGTEGRNGIPSDSTLHKQIRGSPARVGVKKKRKFASPLKRLYEKDFQRRGLAKALFQTQYQMQYKDWLQETGRTAGREGKPRKKQAPTFTYDNVPVHGDPTDPRYLKHLPHPPLPHYPPDLHWRTNYKTHFVEPNMFKYERGAWKSPEPEKAASLGEGGAEPRPQSMPSAEDPERGQSSAEPSGSWFDQLLELRNKAEHYKWKSCRTNFNIHDMVPHEENQVRRSSSDTASTLLPLESCSSGSPASLPGDAVSRMSFISRNPSEAHPGSVGHELRPALQQGDPLEIEDIEDSDLEEEGGHAESAPRHGRGSRLATINVPTFTSGDVKCTCAKGRVPTPGCKVKSHAVPSREYKVNGHSPTPEVKGRTLTPDIRGRVPTPELRRSTSPMRHHLDLTTPSDNGLLIPVTTYSPTSPKFHRDKKSSAPINPLPADSVDRLIADSRKAKEPAREEEEEVSNVPKHIPASSSPYHSHCVPSDVPKAAGSAGKGMRSGIGGGGKGGSHVPRPKAKGGRGGEALPQHVRKLNFERSALSQLAPKRSQSSYQHRPTSVSRFSAPPLSCHTCGVSLQPSVPPPPSSAPPGDGRPKAHALYPASLNTRPTSTLGQSRHIQTGAERGSRRLAGYQRHGEPASTSPIPTSVKGGSPTPPPSRANMYAPTASVGRMSQLKPSYHRNLEVDELSLSSMSLSSCSVASEVLEKARRRRDNFWTSQQQSRE